MTTSDRQSAFSGTREVAERLRFDVARLQDYLAAHLSGFAGPILVSQFKGGQSNPTYLIETPLRRYVLRRKPPGKLLPSAHAVDREHRVISALYAQRFPVAEPLLYCDDESVVGTAFFLMAFAEGRVFWEPHMPDSYPTERAQVYDGMNANWLGCTLSILARSGLAITAAANTTWRGRSRAGRSNIAPPRPNKSMTWSGHRLAAGASAAEQMPRLVHGDYRLDNMIVAADAPTIIAVLDWELSTLGDPLTDSHTT